MSVPVRKISKLCLFLKCFLNACGVNVPNDILLKQSHDVFLSGGDIHAVLTFSFSDILAACQHFQLYIEPWSHLNRMAEDDRSRFVDPLLERSYLFCNFTSWIDHRVRTKRQIGLLALGALGVVDTGLGLYNSYEISQLNSRVTSGFHHVDLVVHDLDHRIDQLEDNLSKFMHRVKEGLACLQSRISRLDWVTDSDLQLNVLTGLLHHAELGWTELLQGKFPRSWLDERSFQDLQNDVSSRLSSLGANRTFSTLELASMDASFMISSNLTVKVFLHIPIVDKIMEHFQHVSRPVFVDGQWLLLSADADESSLLVAPDRKTSLAVDITAAGCNRQIGPHRVCTGVAAVGKQLADYCLGLLLLGFESDLSKKCRFRPLVRSWHVAYVGDNYYSVFVSQQDTLTITCPGASLKRQLLPQTHNNISVSAKCQASSTMFDLIVAKSDRVDKYYLKAFSITLELGSRKGGGEWLNSLDNEIETFETGVKQGRRKSDEDMEALDDDLATYNMPVVLIVVISITATILGVLGCLCCFKDTRRAMTHACCCPQPGCGATRAQRSSGPPPKPDRRFEERFETPRVPEPYGTYELRGLRPGQSRRDHE